MNFGPMEGFRLTTWSRLIPDWQTYEGGDLELVVGMCASDLMIVRSRIKNILQIPVTNLQIGVLWSVRFQWGKNPLWRKIKRTNLSLHVGHMFPSINHDKIVCISASPSERVRIFPKGWEGNLNLASVEDDLEPELFLGGGHP